MIVARRRDYDDDDDDRRRLSNSKIATYCYQKYDMSL
jgi:hypothetical protein